MTNNFPRKPDFTPPVYTRYFERSETSNKQPNHIHFDDEFGTSSPSSSYQTKRDLLFKRIFPSKYADANNNNPNDAINEPVPLNSTGITTTASAAQSLGDFIPLSSVDISRLTKGSSSSSSETDTDSSSSDESTDGTDSEPTLPSIRHDAIVGNVHPRSTIENVRSVLIRELYQRTSDPHTEWLKCKMRIPREYINPKYYADFQRRYRFELKRTRMKTKKTKSKKKRTENGHRTPESTKKNENRREKRPPKDDDDVIEIVDEKQTLKVSTTAVRESSNDLPEFIVLDSDDEEDSNHPQPMFFVDRSSNRDRAPPSQSNQEDYVKEDSKYAQLPSKTNSTSAPDQPSIRPILSKNQRRKKKTPSSAMEQAKPTSTPLVSAIDRIIDHMDQTRNLSATAEEQNAIIKTLKKRKKGKKKKNASNDKTNSI